MLNIPEYELLNPSKITLLPNYNVQNKINKISVAVFFFVILFFFILLKISRLWTVTLEEIDHFYQNTPKPLELLFGGNFKTRKGTSMILYDFTRLWE